MQSDKSSKPRRKFDETFINDVLNMLESGRTVPDVAHSLGINENIIYRWRIKFRPSTAASATLPQPAPSFDPDKAALHKRIQELELERDILKKALGIFSRQM